MVSPGDSSVPAKRLPIITHDAPAASAFEMSPEYLMPPSAMIATSVPFAALAASMMAVSCGTPAPVTTRVVQIEPGPMPTFSPSMPSEISSFAPGHIAGHQLHFRQPLPDRLDRFHHSLGVSVRRVDGQHVGFGFRHFHG